MPVAAYLHPRLLFEPGIIIGVFKDPGGELELLALPCVKTLIFLW